MFDICQKICQIECPIECQKICQILPDRMPEDLLVTKRTDAMVGITRSKVFFLGGVSIPIVNSWNPMAGIMICI